MMATSSPVLREKLTPRASISNSKKKMHRIPSATWREKLNARKDSFKEDLENAFSHKRKKATDGGKGTLVKMARTRDKVIAEIFASEKTYQEQLCIIIQQFMQPLQKLGLLPDPDHKLIFENVKSIQAVNQELLTHMQEKGIPQAFIQLAPFFKVYCTYANSFEKSMQTLQDWERKRADFGQFLRQQESKTEACNLNLDSLLITPIQRVPRYRLLLQELLDNTPEDHDDYDQLKEAVSTISKVTAGINEYIKEHENFQKMLRIQNCLTGAYAPRILAPGRRFLKEGLLMKVSNKGHGSNERMFFLFNDMLVYAKPNLLDHNNMSRGYACRRIICLDRCEVQLVLGEKNVEGAGALFKLIFDDDHLLLYSTDNNVAMSWVDALQGAISLLKENNHARRITSNPSTRRSSRRISRRGILRSSFSLRNKRQYPEDDVNPTSRTAKDSLYPMRTQMLRRKLGTPGRTPPATRRSAKKKSRRLQRGPLPIKTTKPTENSEPMDTSSSLNPAIASSMPEMYRVEDKSTATDVHMPPTMPLFDDIIDGDPNVYDNNGLPFCNLL